MNQCLLFMWKFQPGYWDENNLISIGRVNNYKYVQIVRSWKKSVHPGSRTIFMMNVHGIRHHWPPSNKEPFIIYTRGWAGKIHQKAKQNVLTPYRENRQSDDPSKIHLKCRPPPNTLLLPIKVVRSPQRAKPMREVWYQLCSYLAELVLVVILGDHFLYTVIGFCISFKLRCMNC